MVNENNGNNENNENVGVNRRDDNSKDDLQKTLKHLGLENKKQLTSQDYMRIFAYMQETCCIGS